MLKELHKNEGVVFAAKSLGAYLLWIITRKAFMKISFLQPIWVKINDGLASIYVKLSAQVLEAMGYSLKLNSRNLFLSGTEGLYVGDHCLGLSATFIFAAIILMLKAKWTHKILYALAGIILIFAMNWFRVVGLALMLVHGSKAFFHFNHSYTYLVMVYGLIFAMIVFFEKRFSK
ncbi:MAG: exosortase/archaeosortase family protein [Chitinophagales bacterium]|nr:exosortase/archaeosortase family protein [Chitinophagales bacterium]